MKLEKNKIIDFIGNKRVNIKNVADEFKISIPYAKKYLYQLCKEGILWHTKRNPTMPFSRANPSVFFKRPKEEEEVFYGASG